MSTRNSNGWISIQPVHAKLKPRPQNDYSEWSNDETHNTRIRKQLPLGSQSMPDPPRRSRRERMLGQLNLTKWKTEAFGDTISGPGVKGRTIAPIGISQEEMFSGKHLTDEQKAKSIEQRQAFLCMNRRPVATKLAEHYPSKIEGFLHVDNGDDKNTDAQGFRNLRSICKERSKSNTMMTKIQTRRDSGS
jgi:hypothetical protein